MLNQVALVSQTTAVSLQELVKVAAALQKQVSRDFGPIWGVNATVDAFAQLRDVPLGYWPIVIRDDVAQKFDAAGIHLDKSGQPFALVQTSEGWPLTVSHEALEMLSDPFGDRLVAGRGVVNSQKRVEYLVEVCDPSEDDRFGYTVNDILLSDFYTPHFFDPVPGNGVRYSFTGAITKPRTVLRGGYLSWHNPPDDHWYQLTWFGGSKAKLRDLGVFEASSMSTREWIDMRTSTPRRERIAKAKPRPAYTVIAKAAGTPTSSSGRARMIEEHIAMLMHKA